MELIAIELLLWAWLIFFFWAMRDALDRIESEIEKLGVGLGKHVSSPSCQFRYDQPDRLMESIGNYMDTQIYRYAVIAGEEFQFDHISPVGCVMVPQDEQRCLAPGLVYVRCRAH